MSPVEAARYIGKYSSIYYPGIYKFFMKFTPWVNFSTTAGLKPLTKPLNVPPGETDSQIVFTVSVYRYFIVVLHP
jgi:hypothetical protein